MRQVLEGGRGKRVGHEKRAYQVASLWGVFSITSYHGILSENPLATGSRDTNALFYLRFKSRDLFGRVGNTSLGDVISPALKVRPHRS